MNVLNLRLLVLGCPELIEGLPARLWRDYFGTFLESLTIYTIYSEWTRIAKLYSCLYSYFMVNNNSKAISVIILLNILQLFSLIFLLGWGPNIKDYIIASSLPKPPKTIYLSLSSQSFYPSALIVYHTDLLFNEFLSFYDKEMPKQGWVYDSTPWNVQGSYEKQVVYKRNILGKNYLVQISAIANQYQGLADNHINIRHEN